MVLGWVILRFIPNNLWILTHAALINKAAWVNSNWIKEVGKE
jgi:hypothetical protein